MSGGGLAAVEAADHGVDRGPPDQCFGHRRVAFVVAGQAGVRGQPGEAAFHDPPLRVHHETSLVRGFAGDLDGGLQRLGRPVDQLAGEALIDEHVPDRRRQIGAEQGRLRAVAVLPGRRHHTHHDQQIEGVGDDEPLPAVDGGGASVADYNGADFSSRGCGPVKLIDQSQGAGWVSDAKPTGTGSDTTAIEPRCIVVKLPAAVNVAQVTINPASGWGPDASASTGDFKVETFSDGTTWRPGAQGHFLPSQRTVQTMGLAPGSTDAVQYLRYWMLGTQVADIGGSCPSNHHGCRYVASTELAVHGIPAS